MSEITGGRKRLFSKELRCLLYGLGDSNNPYTETVDFLEDLVIEFITEITHKASDLKNKSGKVSTYIHTENITILLNT